VAFERSFERFLIIVRFHGDAKLLIALQHSHGAVMKGCDNQFVPIPVERDIGRMVVLWVVRVVGAKSPVDFMEWSFFLAIALKSAFNRHSSPQTQAI
jgi:hypothetical protein